MAEETHLEAADAGLTGAHAIYYVETVTDVLLCADSNLDSMPKNSHLNHIDRLYFDLNF